MDYDSARTGPLDGIRVVDLSRLVAGNMLSLQLGDFGADVDQGRAARGRSRCAQWKDERPLAVLEGLWPQQALDRAQPARGRRHGGALGAARRRRRVHREFPAGHAGADGARARRAARRATPTSSSCASPASARPGPMRISPASARIVEAMSGFAASHRLPRPRAGAAAAGAGRHDRRASMAPCRRSTALLRARHAADARAR